MGQIQTEQAVMIVDSVTEALKTVQNGPPPSPDSSIWIMSYLALLPLVAAGLWAFFKRHLIIKWVNSKKGHK